MYFVECNGCLEGTFVSDLLYDYQKPTECPKCDSEDIEVW